MKHIACRRPWASALFAVLAGLLAVVALGGCAGEQAVITPRPALESESLGRNVAVSTTVRDTRSEPVVGRCASAFLFSGKLTLARDPSPAIRAAVNVGLREKGFRPEPKSDQVIRSLAVDLTDLTYTSRHEGDRLTARARVVLAVTAANNGQTMKRRFQAETVWKLAGDDIEPDFDKLFSQVVSKAIKNMFADYDMLNFLEKTVLRTRDIK